MNYFSRRTQGHADAPLFLTFHGTGGTEDQFHDLAEQLVPGAHIVSPRGDVLEHGALRFFRRTGEGVYDMEDLAQRTNAMVSFIQAERTCCAADRIIGLGYSNGANILASVAFLRPELLNDIVLMHPLIPWTPDPQPELAGRRFLITAGRHDPICPAEQTEKLASYLSAQGADVEIFWHSGGHEIDPSEIIEIRNFLEPALP